MLRIVFVAVALINVFPPTNCILEDEITNFLEELRMRMCHPIPNLGLPALDPFKIDNFHGIDIDTKYLVNFTGSVESLEVRGLSDFNVTLLNIQYLPLLRSTISITLPLSSFHSLYTAKGSLGYILNLAGDGKAEGQFMEFAFSISWILKSGVNLGIRGLQITIHLGDLHIMFENFFEEERINHFFYALINEMGLELLDDLWTFGEGTIVNKVEDRLNDFLGNYTLADIIKLITGNGGEEGAPIFGEVEPDCKLDSLTKIYTNLITP